MRALRGRSVWPTLSADLRKSLFAHFELFADDADDVDDDAEITLVGDSSLGGCGGSALLLYNFCFVGDEDVLFDDGTGGLFDLDFSLFDDALFIELLREIDGDFDMELSLDDFDGLFSFDFSGDFSKLFFSSIFSGELAVESFSFLLALLYLDSDVVFEVLLKRE